ncbi:hypothetical protein E2C01_052721 [Portunus trituberculatus]|uniref:Uncharacterized protein n=1 Tax=Portunus trituberculatus TaxID=210409 RepID=A0A5B7GMI0_PORTR|nr:hypothetical protein [Portunus trituberculatus]
MVAMMGGKGSGALTLEAAGAVRARGTEALPGDGVAGPHAATHADLHTARSVVARLAPYTVWSREARRTVLDAYACCGMARVPVGTLTLMQAAGPPFPWRALFRAVWPHVARHTLAHAALL